jgi:hypothetical protein
VITPPLQTSAIFYQITEAGLHPHLWLCSGSRSRPKQASRASSCSMKLYRPGDQLLILHIPDDWPEAQLPRNRELTKEELASVEAEYQPADVDD